MSDLDKFANGVSQGTQPQKAYKQITGEGKNLIRKESPEERLIKNREQVGELINKYKLNSERFLKELDWGLTECKQEKDFKAHKGYLELVLKIQESYAILYGMQEKQKSMQDTLDYIKNDLDEEKAKRIIESK